MARSSLLAAVFRLSMRYWHLFLSLVMLMLITGWLWMPQTRLWASNGAAMASVDAWQGIAAWGALILHGVYLMHGQYWIPALLSALVVTLFWMQEQGAYGQ